MKGKPLCAHYCFILPFFDAAVVRAGERGLKAKMEGEKKSTFCPQQWNITSMPRPLLTEGACSHTETEHLLHFNMLLPHFQNIR